ncbi:MAG: DEAD/DEAH box helicase [Planctomycetes bacterium]|nr:DEAD/DEAH box helicase [Planctomycetota bacterium]
MKLFDAVAELKGVGEQRGALLQAAGVATLFDLLLVTPGRYSAPPALAQQPGTEPCSLWGTVLKVRRGRMRGRAGGFAELRLDCGGHEVLARLYGQGWIGERITAGMKVVISGRSHGTKSGEFVASSCVEAADESALQAVLQRLQAVRPKLDGLAAGTLARLLDASFDAGFADPLQGLLPPGLPTLQEAFEGVHRPRDRSAATRGAERLLFDRFVALLVSIGAPPETGTAPCIAVSPRVHERIDARLPFTLTPAQRRALDEVLADMNRAVPMRRVLQGDVGSGKTAVAVAAALATVAARRQVLFLAPTQELAEQHYALLTRWLVGSKVRLGLLTSAGRRGGRADASAARDVDILTGTHAALAEQVRLPALALVVVDEQHRFGVRNRLAAVRKGSAVHALSISATPIPRTLALSLLGSLPRSVVEGRPPGRGAVSTRLATVREAVSEVARVAARGERVFCVYPGIDALGAPALLREGQRLVAPRGPLSAIPYVMAHGRMPPEKRQAALASFRSGGAQLLLATVVVEVGLDVPEATLMVIFGAERHGLATLHQLRGRVGRGTAPGTCLLIPSATALPAALARLQVLLAESDGFRLAEADLEQRGPGEVLGLKQAGHGAMLQVAAAAQTELLEQARAVARSVLERGTPETLHYCNMLHGASAPVFRPQDAL